MSKHAWSQKVAVLRDHLAHRRDDVNRLAARIEELEAEVVRLKRELEEARAAARSLPASVQEALNSGDGSYRP